MKTTLLKTNHQKCIEALELLEKAQERLKYWMALSVKHQMTTFQNELKLWPIGRPGWDSRGKYGQGQEWCEEQVNLYSNKIIPRLEKRYLDLLDKITSHV
jgi:hypothetical protein